MLLSVLEMYLEPKAKISLRVPKIQHLGVEFKSPMKWIRILIPECYQNVLEKTKFESSCFGFESQFQKKISEVKK